MNIFIIFNLIELYMKFDQNIYNLIKIYTIWLNNYLGWVGPVHGSGWIELSVCSSGISWVGLKNLVHGPPTNFTVRAGLDRAFRGLSPHGPRGGLDWMDWIGPHSWSSLLANMSFVNWLKYH